MLDKDINLFANIRGQHLFPMNTLILLWYALNLISLEYNNKLF